MGWGLEEEEASVVDEHVRQGLVSAKALRQKPAWCPGEAKRLLWAELCLPNIGPQNVTVFGDRVFKEVTKVQ